MTLCIVAKRCILEQKLLLRAYRKSYIEKLIGTKINDLDLRLEVVSSHVNHCLTFDVEYLGKRLGSKGPPIGNEMAYGLSNGHVTDDVT